MNLKLLFICSLVSVESLMAIGQHSVSLKGMLNADSITLQSGTDTLQFMLRRFKQKPNMYVCSTSENIESIKRRFPEEVKTSVAVANQVRNNLFVFRSNWDMEKTNVPYQFKKDINWSLIPFGDEEWCFMLNRHRYWIDLGKAYLFTKDEAYARAWIHQVEDWIAKNPVDNPKLRSLSWRRIEAGIRCETWIKSFECFKNSPAVTPQFLGKFINSLYQHATYLDAGFSDFSKTSNWGVLEFQGLLNAALFLSDFQMADRWKNDAIAHLACCANLQVLPDGSQWEHSPMYHNEVFHCLLNVNYLAQKFNLELPVSLIEKTRALASANVKWQKPNFHQPLIGDSDDSDLRDLLTLAAFLFNDGVLKSRAFEQCDYDNSLITTKQQQQDYNRIPAKTPDFTSVYLQSSGDMVMRNSWDQSANYMTLQLKKIACGHAHDDLLNVALYANGRDYLVDGGRFTYVESDKRQKLKSSLSHNSLMVDDLPNSVYSSSWSNSYNAESNYVYTKLSPDFDYVEANNTAYQRLDDPAMLTRRVLYIKPGLWLIFDTFNAKGTHKYSLNFNFPDKNVKLQGPDVTTTYDDGNLLVKSVKPVQASMTDMEWSPEYNLMVPGSRVQLSHTLKGDDSFITALYFPNQGAVNITQLPVYNRTNQMYSNNIAEAIQFTYNAKEYVVLMVYKLAGSSAPFYKLKDQLVSGSVVLLEKQGDTYKYNLIKE